MAITQGFPESVVEEHTRAGHWGRESLAEHVGRRAGSMGDSTAFHEARHSLTWERYDSWSTRLGAGLRESGLHRGSLVGVFLPDVPATHVVYLALEKAGCTTVGIGPRSGRHEIEHLLRVTGAQALVTTPELRGEDQSLLFADVRERLPSLRQHLVLDADDEDAITVDGERLLLDAEPRQLTDGLEPNDVFLVNATSGTTGLPKCVQHTQNRWIRFAQHAIDAGGLTTDDVMMSALPTPFGFGLWTAHFLPALLGIPAVLMERWDPAQALVALREHGVSIFAGVTTQLMMMLEILESEPVDLPRLRVVFTGGEAVPYDRARRFEQLTGCSVLQFYGSNESGALSNTSVRDDEYHRLRTAGRIIPEMHVELVDPATGEPVTQPGRQGQPTCRGPLASPGYLGDADANAALFDARGRMRMADLATISDDGYLTVVGRVADIIIRGGTNVSAAEIEAAVVTHPAVELAAVVGVPDATFGERICAFVVLRPGTALSLDDLQAYLKERGMARYSWPERLEVLDEMPISTGEKIAKAELKRRAQ